MSLEFINLYYVCLILSHSLSQYLHTQVTHKDIRCEPFNDKDRALVLTCSADV